MNIDEMVPFVERAEKGEQKSIKFSELRDENFLPKKNGILVPYLDMIAKDLEKEG